MPRIWLRCRGSNVHLAELTGRRVAVLGLGRDVLAALPAIVAAGPAELVAVDGAPDAGDRTDLEIRSLDDAASVAEILVRAPGFPRYDPTLIAARAAGAAMTTPLDLWVGSRGADRTVAMVTGTKGKSTVTELAGRFAHEAGFRMGMAGNVGVPVFAAGWDAEAPVVVLEVSSYQAADLHHCPDVAVVTFLSEDHLSWHGGRAQYVEDKLRVVRNDGGVAGRVLVGPEAGDAPAALADRGIVPEVVAVPPAPAHLPRHRVQNASLARAVLAAVGGPALDDHVVVTSAASGLPGRLDRCPGPYGLWMIDDALGSNPTAAAAGLAWLREVGRPTIVLLGGLDRGVDATPLATEAALWPRSALRAIALPENGARLAAQAGIEVMAEASSVADAADLAIAAAAEGGAVLFSPGAPTLAVDGDWEARSAAFRRAAVLHAG